MARVPGLVLVLYLSVFSKPCRHIDVERSIYLLHALVRVLGQISGHDDSVRFTGKLTFAYDKIHIDPTLSWMVSNRIFTRKRNLTSKNCKAF